jgi:dephospho-CoA kinase
MPLYIGLVGKKGCGKDSFGKLLKEILPEKKIEVVRFSDILFIEKTRHNLQHLAVVLDNGFGKGTLTNAVEMRLRNIQADIVVLDGIRWKTDIEMLRKLPDNKLVYITTDTQVRFERISQRKEKAGEAGVSYEQFIQEDNAENELYIEEIGAGADYNIENNGSLEELKEKLKDLSFKL